MVVRELIEEAVDHFEVLAEWPKTAIERIDYRSIVGIVKSESLYPLLLKVLEADGQAAQFELLSSEELEPLRNYYSDQFSDVDIKIVVTFAQWYRTWVLLTGNG